MAAKWIRIAEENGEEHYQCSHCGMMWFLAFGNPLENEMYYCPKCGKRMEKTISTSEMLQEDNTQ